MLTKMLILNPKTHLEEIKILKTLENLKEFLLNPILKIENLETEKEKN